MRRGVARPLVRDARCTQGEVWQGLVLLPACEDAILNGPSASTAPGPRLLTGPWVG